MKLSQELYHASIVEEDAYLEELADKAKELEDKIAKLQWQLSYRDDNDLSLRYGSEEDLR